MKFLKRVTTASTYDERHRLLQKKFRFAKSWPCLGQCLREPYHFNVLHYPEVLDVDMWFAHSAMWYLTEGPTRFAKSDPDRGPAQIWYQEHAETDRRVYVMSSDSRASRKVAYVMMDISRRHAMVHFKGRDVSMRWYPFDPFDEVKDDNEWDQKYRSYQLRKAIYRLGGRGWWSEDDSRQITWMKPSGLVSALLSDLI